MPNKSIKHYNDHFKCRKCKYQFNLFTTTCGRLYCYRCMKRFICRCNCSVMYKLMQNNDIDYRNVYNFNEENTKARDRAKQLPDLVYIFTFGELFFLVMMIMCFVYVLYKLQMMEPTPYDWRDGI